MLGTSGTRASMPGAAGIAAGVGAGVDCVAYGAIVGAPAMIERGGVCWHEARRSRESRPLGRQRGEGACRCSTTQHGRPSSRGHPAATRDRGGGTAGTSKTPYQVPTHASKGRRRSGSRTTRERGASPATSRRHLAGGACHRATSSRRPAQDPPSTTSRASAVASRRRVRAPRADLCTHPQLWPRCRTLQGPPRAFSNRRAPQDERPLARSPPSVLRCLHRVPFTFNIFSV